jgi:hypothetical protein
MTTTGQPSGHRQTTDPLLTALPGETYQDVLDRISTEVDRYADAIIPMLLYYPATRDLAGMDRTLLDAYLQAR